MNEQNGWRTIIVYINEDIEKCHFRGEQWKTFLYISMCVSVLWLCSVRVNTIHIMCMVCLQYLCLSISYFLAFCLFSRHIVLLIIKEEKRPKAFDTRKYCQRYCSFPLSRSLPRWIFHFIRLCHALSCLPFRPFS